MTKITNIEPSLKGRSVVFAVRTAPTESILHPSLIPRFTTHFSRLRIPAPDAFIKPDAQHQEYSQNNNPHDPEHPVKSSLKDDQEYHGKEDERCALVPNPHKIRGVMNFAALQLPKNLMVLQVVGDQKDDKDQLDVHPGLLQPARH